MKARRIYCWEHGHMPAERIGPVPLEAIRSQVESTDAGPVFAGAELGAIEADRQALCLIHANDEEWRRLQGRAEQLQLQEPAIFFRVSLVNLEPAESRIIETASGTPLLFLELPDSRRLRDNRGLRALLAVTTDEARAHTERKVRLSPQLEAIFQESDLPEVTTSLKLLLSFTQAKLGESGGHKRLAELWRRTLPLDWESRLRREFVNYLSEAERRSVEPFIQAIPPVLRKDATRENFQQLQEAASGCVW
jgi:hypothetical protein